MHVRPTAAGGGAATFRWWPDRSHFLPLCRADFEAAASAPLQYRAAAISLAAEPRRVKLQEVWEAPPDPPEATAHC